MRLYQHQNAKMPKYKLTKTHRQTGRGHPITMAKSTRLYRVTQTTPGRPALVIIAQVGALTPTAHPRHRLLPGPPTPPPPSPPPHRRWPPPRCWHPTRRRRARARASRRRRRRHPPRSPQPPRRPLLPALPAAARRCRWGGRWPARRWRGARVQGSTFVVEEGGRDWIDWLVGWWVDCWGWGIAVTYLDQ